MPESIFPRVVCPNCGRRVSTNEFMPDANGMMTTRPHRTSANRYQPYTLCQALVPAPPECFFEVRTCRQCGQTKAISEFPQCSKSGHLTRCAACRALDRRTSYRRNYEKQRQADKEYRKTHPNRQTDRAKARAREAVKRSVKSGILGKPDACSKCGAECCVLTAHHHDYSKPLDVTWLCYKCHGNEHRTVSPKD